MTPTTPVYVEIVKRADSLVGSETVVKRLGPMSASKADKVEDGANRNLNHDEYFTRIVSQRALWRETPC